MSFDNRQYPYDTVVYITATIGGSGFTGSGVLISPDEVLTATHVVYSSTYGSATLVTASPGYNLGVAPFGTATASYFHYHAINDAGGLISLSDSQYDYAVIHLNTAFSLGYMGYESLFPGGAVHVTGYPASSGGGETDFTETVTRNPAYTLLDGTDTGQGSSGGPVWVMQNGGPYVVGVVSSANGLAGHNFQITSAAFQQIQAWVAQDDLKDPLVDVAYYEAHNLDVARAPGNPIYHYEATGWREGRDPSAFFSTSGYLAANPDVKAAGVNPLDHYDASGWKEGRDPGANFDTSLYLLHNPDVAKAGIDPLAHYLEYGRYEGRTIYPAIGPARSIFGDFAPEYYLLANEDVSKADVDAWTHFDQAGWREGRNPDPFFDTKWYLSNNPDVARAGIDPLLHYEQFGWKEGRNPSPGFSTEGYLSHYSDVARAGIDPLQHYLTSGIYEGRSSFGT